jgi:1,2-dihydroxy-3-keto-5-methylthiopentene dioxygenase
MGHLTVITDETATADVNEISKFLKSYGIDYGLISRPARALELAELQTLTDAQRLELIALYPEAVDRFSARKGYRADVVCFYPEFPHIDHIIGKFGAIHFHFENEYWYFVDGEALFGFLGKDGTKFELRVLAGEYLQVPEGCWQWFLLTEKKRMKSIRFFYTEDRVPARAVHKFPALGAP